MATPIISQAPVYVKDVRRNKETRDFDAYVTVDGVEIYISSHKWSWDAESACDTYVHDDLQRRPSEAQRICPTCGEVIDSIGRCGCDYKPTRRSWIEADGTPMENITVQGAELQRVVGEDVAYLAWAGRSFDVTSEDLRALAALLG